jgi:hypothetical protein
VIMTGEVPGEQLCWSEPWMRFSARTGPGGRPGATQIVQRGRPSPGHRHIGIGLGKPVGTVTGPAGHPVGFASFVAPALLATSAMNGAILDSTSTCSSG